MHPLCPAVSGTAQVAVEGRDYGERAVRTIICLYAVVTKGYANQRIRGRDAKEVPARHAGDPQCVRERR
jgi:hypothetical protein